MAAYARWTDAAVTELARDPAFEGVSEDGSFFDFLLELFKELAPMLLACFATPKEAAQAARSLSPFRRARVRLFVFRNVPREVYREFGGQVADAVIATARTVTDEEMEEVARTVDVEALRAPRRNPDE